MLISWFLVFWGVIIYMVVECVGVWMFIFINEKELVISLMVSVVMEFIVCLVNNGVECSVVSIGFKEVLEYNFSRELVGRFWI